MWITTSKEIGLLACFRITAHANECIDGHGFAFFGELAGGKRASVFGELGKTCPRVARSERSPRGIEERSFFGQSRIGRGRTARPWFGR